MVRLITALISSVFLLVLVLPANAQNTKYISCQDGLTPSDVEKVKESQRLLGPADDRTLEAALAELRVTGCPSVQVLMLESMARTYADLIGKYDLTDADAQKRLYGKISMNMAFLQLAGGRGEEDKSSLNRLIRRKLVYYLPEGMLEHPGFYTPPL